MLRHLRRWIYTTASGTIIGTIIRAITKYGFQTQYEIVIQDGVPLKRTSQQVDNVGFTLLALGYCLTSWAMMLMLGKLVQMA